MCGRYTHTGEPIRSARQLKAVNEMDLWTPRYNIAPTQAAPVALLDGGRVLRSLRWGFRQAQSFSSSGLLINVRSETVATKPRFKKLLQKNRCLVPADGFFEWQWSGKQRLPMRFVMRDEGLFFMAGLWDWQTGAEGAAPTQVFVILTTEANDLVQPLHDRMPVIIPESKYSDWLETADAERWDWQPYPADHMAAFQVSPVVNSPSVDSPECIASLGPFTGESPVSPQLELGL